MLEVRNLTLADAGVYSCDAFDLAQQTKADSQCTRLIMHATRAEREACKEKYKPVFSQEQIRLAAAPRVVLAGENLALSCEPSGE